MLVPDAASVLILDSLAVVIVPDNVATLLEVLRNLIAPELLTPVPLIVMGSVIVSAEVALISIAVPVATLVPCDASPNAAALEICTTPVVIEVVPA